MNTSSDRSETFLTSDPTANPDPITHEPGSHPVSTGAGAVGAGLAGAALGTMVGPLGSIAGGIVGAVVGAVAGGLLGKEAGEALNPTYEADYWRSNHGTQSYAANSTYENYANAYRAGYEGQSKYAAKHRSFEDAEPFIRDDYAAFKSPLEWEQARPASNAAWKRREETAEHRSSYPGIGV